MDHTTHFLKPRLVTEMIWIPEMQPPSLLHPLLLCSFTHNGNLCISFVVSVQYKDKFSILPDALFSLNLIHSAILALRCSSAFCRNTYHTTLISDEHPLQLPMV